jgi:hypothetical protein
MPQQHAPTDHLAHKSILVADQHHSHQFSTDKAHVKPVYRIKAWESQSLLLPQGPVSILFTIHHAAITTIPAPDFHLLPTSYAAITLRGPPAIG